MLGLTGSLEARIQCIHGECDTCGRGEVIGVPCNAEIQGRMRRKIK